MFSGVVAGEGGGDGVLAQYSAAWRWAWRQVRLGLVTTAAATPAIGATGMVAAIHRIPIGTAIPPTTVATMGLDHTGVRVAYSVIAWCIARTGGTDSARLSSGERGLVARSRENP